MHQFNKEAISVAPTDEREMVTPLFCRNAVSSNTPSCCTCSSRWEELMRERLKTKDPQRLLILVIDESVYLRQAFLFRRLNVILARGNRTSPPISVSLLCIAVRGVSAITSRHTACRTRSSLVYCVCFSPMDTDLPQGNFGPMGY